MILSPIAFIAPNYRDFKGRWIKFYEPATTTAKIIYLDQAATILVSKVQINADGFIVSAGGAIVVPYVNSGYDAYIFDSETDADDNNTSGAIRIADNIQNDISGFIPFDNVQEMIAADLSVGQLVQCKRYYEAGSLIPGLEYEIQSNSGADGYVNHSLSNGNVAYLFKNIFINIEQAGGSSNNSINNRPVIEAIDAQGIEYCYFKSSGDYLFNSSPTLTQLTSIISSDTTLSGATFKDVNSSVIKRDYKLKVKYPAAIESNHLLPFDIYFKGGRYFTDFDPRSLRPARSQTRYVDPILGSDSNNGGINDPYKTIARAATTAQTVDIEIILKAGKYYYKDSLAGTSTNSKGVNIICKEGVATLTNDTYPRTWREDPSNLGVWSASTVLFGESLFTEKANIRFLDMNGRDSDTARGYQIPESTVANIDNGTVGFAAGNSNTRIRMPYDRNPNTDLKIAYAKTNLDLRCNDLTNQQIYIENINTLYGSPNSARFDTSTAQSKVILINCNFSNGHNNDTVEIQGTGLSVLYRCSANGGYKDGFNYQVNLAVSGSSKHDIVEIECTSKNNGIDLLGFNNGSTIHGTCNIIRLNCDHSNNQNRNVHDVGTSRSFNVAVRAEGSETYMEGFQSGLSGGVEPSQMWLVGCKSDIVTVEATSTINISYDTVYGEINNNGGSINVYKL